MFMFVFVFVFGISAYATYWPPSLARFVEYFQLVRAGIHTLVLLPAVFSRYGVPWPVTWIRQIRVDSQSLISWGQLQIACW
jgi:hypothetical protein